MGERIPDPRHGFQGALDLRKIDAPSAYLGHTAGAAKEDRIRTDRAHAALVFDENGLAQGWCQDGSPEELPGIKHRREYSKDAPPRPDWRITCFYVDKKHRGQGIARAGLLDGSS